MKFEPFPKIARLSRDIIITEKLDGTNASVHIVPGFEAPGESHGLLILGRYDYGDGCEHVMLAASRTRFISPTDDNQGFAKWAQAHVEALWALGPGSHFGEWWGQKIQRGYGLTEKRFSLFNTTRWAGKTPDCVDVVPVLYQGPFESLAVGLTLSNLRDLGSRAAPGFMQPEGIVIFHTAANICFKKTIEKDEQPKGQQS